MYKVGGNHSGSIKVHNNIFYQTLLNLADVAGFYYVFPSSHPTSSSNPSASFSLVEIGRGGWRIQGWVCSSQSPLTPASSCKEAPHSESGPVLLRLYWAGQFRESASELLSGGALRELRPIISHPDRLIMVFVTPTKQSLGQYGKTPADTNSLTHSPTNEHLPHWT
jgi:hypothetical protein